MRRIAQPMRLTVPMNDMTLLRDDAAWLRELGATDHRQADALVDLQRILLRGLARSFGGNGSVDDGFLEDVVQDAIVKLLPTWTASRDGAVLLPGLWRSRSGLR